MLIGTPFVFVQQVPIVLVPGRDFAVRHAQARARYPFLPDLPPLVAELNELTRTGGVAVSVDEPRGGNGRGWIRCYARRSCIGLRSSQRGDAFVAEFIEPMSLRNHGRLARSLLRVAPPAWLYSPVLATVPAGCAAPEAQLRDVWQRLRTRATPAAEPRRDPRYEAFCDALDVVIEGARQIETARDTARPALAYYEVRTAARARRSTVASYVFLLSTPGQVNQGEMVELRQAPDLRGRVKDIDGERLTVRFDTAVDRRRIPAQGDLVVSGNDVVQRVQGDAVARLRSGSALNPRLLPLLVDLSFSRYQLDAATAAAQPAEPLDDDQLTAFRRALSVPDLLLVLGPPGTGKTRTIVEMAAAAAGRGERVLISSQTNTAVDNVIERLPASITAVRVGKEERFSGAVAHKTLAAVAADLRQRVLSRTGSTHRRLAPWSAEPSPAEGWFDRMTTALGDLRRARAAHAGAGEAARAATAAVRERHHAPIERATRARDAARREVDVADERIRRLTDQLGALDRRGTGGPLGFVHRWRAGRCRLRLAEATPRGGQAHAELTRAEKDLDTCHAALRQALDTDPNLHRTTARAHAAEAAVVRGVATLRQAARQYARLLAGIVEVRAVPDDAETLDGFVDWCRQWHPVLQQRARLMTDWRRQLAEPSDQLHAELIRYADVIGTTCIGAGIQKNLLSDLDFDLAIIDEAGQIPLTSTLVPLVRARRAVLVGDHHQLPPFVDDDVRQWLRHRGADGSGPDPAQLTDLLTRSAFERLILRAPATNQVLLAKQRRMPAVLADFVSAQFYDGRLGTDTNPRPPSPVFRSPLALVDTAGLPARERAERRRERSETWQAAGSDNLAEGRLVQDLVQWYARNDREWAVIAPYRAQVQLLTMRMREMLGEDAVRDRVGTVDAFQGKEYDIVVYSFTRSNTAGRVGFLHELRRLNVAITRAREQLILVGDFSTLVRADDAGFRHLAGELYRYARRHGDIVAARDLRSRLA